MQKIVTRRGNSTAWAISRDKDLVSREEQRKWSMCDGFLLQVVALLPHPPIRWSAQGFGWNLVKLRNIDRFDHFIKQMGAFVSVVTGRHLGLELSNATKASSSLVPSAPRTRPGRSWCHISPGSLYLYHVQLKHLFSEMTSTVPFWNPTGWYQMARVGGKWGYKPRLCLSSSYEKNSKVLKPLLLL